MNNLTKNLQEKNYNPCGTLTGQEKIICDSARKNFFNLPYTQIIRNVVISEIDKFNPDENFLNKNSLIDWSKYNLNSEEIKSVLDFNADEFKNFSQIEVGLCKYFVHVLFENRYNIFYNRLVDFCGEIDEKIFVSAEKNNLTFDVLEQKINSLAGNSNFSMTFNDLTDEFLNFIVSYA